MEKVQDSQTYRAAIYIRISKEDGDKTESNSIVNQRALIYSFLEEKPEIKVCAERVDDGYSGIHFNRPGIKELLEEVKEGSINCIIVKDLSRFGRNYIETGRYIQQIFPFMGVRFIAINDSYDSVGAQTQMEHMILPFKNLMNDSYCRDISLKVRSQIEVRQKRGDYIGSFPLYGYFRDMEQRNRLVIDETVAPTIRAIFTMRISGMNNKKIAEYLNARGIPSPMEYKAMLHWRYSTSFRLKPHAVWSPLAVERILKNEIYTGAMVQGKERTLNYKNKKRIKVPQEEWIRVAHTHEPIISAKDFAVVQELMRCDTRTAPLEETLYLLSGFLYCGDCGCNMIRRTITSSGMKYVYYICSANKNNKEICSSHRIREDNLREAVFAVLQMQLNTVNTLNELRTIEKTQTFEDLKILEQKKQLACRKNEAERYKKLQLFVYEDYKEGLLKKQEYLEMKAAYQEVYEQIEKSIQTLEKQQGKEAYISNDRLESFQKSGRIEVPDRRLLALMIDKITIWDAHNITIKFKYQDEWERFFLKSKEAE